LGKLGPGQPRARGARGRRQAGLLPRCRGVLRIAIALLRRTREKVEEESLRGDTPRAPRAWAAPPRPLLPSAWAAPPRPLLPAHGLRPRDPCSHSHGLRPRYSCSHPHGLRPRYSCSILLSLDVRNDFGLTVTRLALGGGLCLLRRRLWRIRLRWRLRRG